MQGKDRPSVTSRRRALGRLWVLTFACIALACASTLGCNSGEAGASAEGDAAAAGDPTKMQFVNGFQPGLRVAHESGRPMLVFFTASWCQYCHQMADDAFRQEGVVALSRQFVCVQVDADAEPHICREFHIRGFPTIQFMSPGGVPLNRVTGKRPAHELVMEMQAALQAVARGLTRPTYWR